MSYRKLLSFEIFTNNVLCKRTNNLHNTFSKFYSKKSPEFNDKPVYSDAEINFHSQLAEKWWDMKTVGPLHSMNAARVPFIQAGLNQMKPKWATLTDESGLLDGINILEVGCGGGILTEPLARLKANVTGLDPCHELIDVARKHAGKDQQLENFLKYEEGAVNHFSQNNEHKFDAVVISEVIEHISNEEKESFLQDCLRCLKPGGSIFVTTPNKTIFTKIIMVMLFERLRIIPLGTHHHDKFISPVNLEKLLNAFNCSVIRVEGFIYDAFTGKTFLSSNRLFMYYAMHAIKNVS